MFHPFCEIVKHQTCITNDICMRIKFFFLLLLVILESCSNESNYVHFITPAKPTLSISDAHHLQYNIKNVTDESIYKDIDEISLIPLETNDKSLIGRVYEIKIINNRIYVCDRYQAKTILVFDNQGHFLHQIGKVGHGKQEYVQMFDYWFGDNYIDILDCLQWKVLRYDYNGKYVKTIDVSPVSDISRFIEYEENKYLLVYQSYSESHPYRLVYTDSLFNIQNTAFPFEHTRDMVAGKLYMNKNKEYNCHFELNDTIYSISDSLITPKYILSFYKKGEALDYIRKTADLDQNDYIRKFNSDDKDLVKNYIFYDLDSYLFVVYRLGAEINSSIISKKDGSHRTYYTQNLSRKSDNLFPFLPYGQYKNEIISIIDKDIASSMSDEGLSAFKSRIVKNKNINVDKILNNNSNNPTICLFHIKNKK